MNRPIKFRIWDTENKKWIIAGWHNNVYQAEYYIDVDGVVRVLNYDSLDIVKNVIIQQYTGLQDKDGKEIYEGDIICIKESDPTSSGNNSICTVEYIGCGFCYRDAYTKKIDSLFTILGEATKDEYAEVIGNIFENLDLIK